MGAEGAGSPDRETRDVLVQPLLIATSRAQDIDRIECSLESAIPLESVAGSARRRPRSSRALSRDEIHRENQRATDGNTSRSSPVEVLGENTRILDRDAPYFQSRGRWGVRHVSRQAASVYHRSDGGAPTRVTMSKKFWDGWFHALAYQRTFILLSILFIVYTAIVVNFAAVYYILSTWGQNEKTNPDGSISIQSFCDMDIHTHMEALYFSLSTLSTIGYGVSDYYFGGCWSPLILVLLEVCCGISFAAVATSLLFLRVSRGHKRGKTVLFSDKAVIRRVRGVPHLMFRVVELRRHQLLGVTVRAFVIRHERHVVSPPTEVTWGESSNDTKSDPLKQRERVSLETVHYVTKPLPLLHERAGSPDAILMSLPQTLVHRMDECSPLLPPSPLWYDAHGTAHTRNGIELGPSIALKDVQEFIQDREAEIVILLEGTEELTGAAIQTRHSYSSRDLLWEQTFVPCVYPSVEHDEDADPERSDSRNNWRSTSCFRTRRRRGNSGRAVCVVDFARFHDTVPAPNDCESCPYVVE